jgi:hypothetical protein
MAMIKDALSSVPSKPALWIAPILVVLVLSLYYRDQYVKCVEIRQTRDALNEHLFALGSPANFRLAEFTDFNWTSVRIVASVSLDTISVTCPLDWNWDSGERESLVASGWLTAMVFVSQGQVIRYVELRADQVEFRGTEGNLTPQAADFSVLRKPDSDGVILTLNH